MSKSFPEGPKLFRSSSENDLEKTFQKEKVISKNIVRIRKK